MPKLGLQMSSGTILKWLKNEGEAVRQGEVLLSIESDKSTMDIEAPCSGTLMKIVRLEGDEVSVTEVIAYIGESGKEPPR